MQKMNCFGMCTLLLGFAFTSHAEPQSPVKDSAGQTVHPVTIRGKAINHERKTVPGAKVFLISSNRASAGGAKLLIAETTSNEDGEYLFRDAPLPLDTFPSLRTPTTKLTEGSFQVFALADGYGLTWHPKLRYSVNPRPKEQSEKDMSYAGEEGQADLAFDLPAKLSGLMTNDRGQPLPGVRVQVGYCDDPRRPDGHGNWSCSYLGPQGDELQFENGRFDGIRHVPEKYRMAITDDKGRYQFTHLRRDTQYLMLLNAGPECDPVMFTGVTSTKVAGNHRALGYDGQVSESFKTPWHFVVKVVSADGQPQANVKVRVRSTRILRAPGRLAETDAAGQAGLKLLADKYTLFLDPPYGSPYVLTEREVTVSPESAAEINSLTLNAAAMLFIRAVEEGTDKPLPGVSFVEEIDSGKRRQELQSQTVFVDHPVTNDHGELQALVTPGERRLLVAKQPAGFEPVNKASELLKSPAKGLETVTFTFKKSGVAPAATDFIREDTGELGKLNTLILRQEELTRSGRFELKSYISLPSGVSGAELRSVLAACNPQEIPNLPALLNKTNPTVKIAFGTMVAVVDGAKIRNEIDLPQVDLSSRNVMVFNGVETVDYSPVNAQATVYSGSTIHLTDSNEVTSWRPIYKMKQRPGDPDIERKITREKGRLVVEAIHQKSIYRQVFDEKTGFLYHQAFLHDGGASGKERWQFAPRGAPNGGIVAGLTVEANHHQGKLGLLQIYEVTLFTPGAPPPDSFVVSVPSGTQIVDVRGNQRSPKQGVVSEPVTDVVARANQISDNSRSILNVLKDSDPAPPIEPAAWLNADGPTEKLDWKGKVLLVDFWGTGCGPCIGELPAVQAFAVKFQKAGGVVLGLHNSGAEPAAVTGFVRKRGLTYQFAIDKPDPNTTSFGATFQAYGIRGIPNCAVIDKKGNVTYLGHFEQAAERATKLLEMEAK